MAFASGNIESVIIGSSVEYIGTYAFGNNPISHIEILGESTRFNSVWVDIGFPIELLI